MGLCGDTLSNEQSRLPYGMAERNQYPELLGAAATWGVAGTTYEGFSAHFADALSHCVQRLAPRAGESILDVATGTGWTARLAALRGAKVTGVDYSEELVASAQAIAKQHHLCIEFDVGDAQCLPYRDGQFDAVISTFGVIFARDPVRAANELARVCRSGGRIALTVWASNGSVASLAREVLAKFSPLPPGPPPASPFAWGSEARLQELLGDEFDLKVEEATSVLREPDGEAVWELWLNTHGPTVTRVSKLDAETAAAFKNAFVSFHERYRTELGISMSREYLVAVGTRR